MSNNNNGVDKFKDMLKKPKLEGSVHEQFFGPIEKDNVNTSDNTSIEDTDNLPDNVEVSVTNIPVAKRKKSIRETHKSKDIAKLIEEDIRKGSRGDMTKIANALFEEYYRSQGRIK